MTFLILSSLKNTFNNNHNVHTEKQFVCE